MENKSLPLSGPRFFRYRKDRERGGGWIPLPLLDTSENWSICTYDTINFVVVNFSVLRVLGLKKASKFGLEKIKICFFRYFKSLLS